MRLLRMQGRRVVRHRRRKDRQCRCAKSRKNLATAAEHDSRQGLIISALKQELPTVDQYIVV